MNDNQAKRNLVLKNLDAYLTQFGFRKKQFTFKRETEPGLFQVIEFSLGPGWSIETGKVRMEFGIFTEEWFTYLMRGSKYPALLRTPYCEIRDMNCTLVRFSKEWYDLNKKPDSISNSFISDIEQILMPYFNQMKDPEGHSREIQ